MNDMNTNTKKHDWGMFFLGILLIICAVIIMAWPGITLVTMALFAGFMLLFAAGGDLAAFFSVPKGTTGRSWMMVNAILDIILGAMFIIHPVASAEVLPWLAGIFVVAYGVAAIASSISFRSLGSGWVLMLFNGILSILIGIFFFIDPAYFVIFVGIYLIMRGIVMCVSGVIAPRNLPYN